MHDVVIIGAGPAGLSAALVLGRCQRRTLVLDDGHPRNAASPALHGYLTRDGTPPSELRRLGRSEIARYPEVEIRETRVISVRQEIDYFSVQVENGEPQAGRLLLLATGRCDEIPDKTGFRRFYGRGVYHCPFCDGWEHRNGALVCYGRGRGALDLAVELRTWSADVHLCTDGPVEWSDEELALLAEAEVRHEDRQIASLEGSERLQAISFADQTRLRCDALFFYSGCSQRSTLPERLGCTFDESGAVRCTGFRATGVTGLFVAGNVQGGLHMAISAAAEGAHAAIDINDELLKRGFLAVAPILQA